MTARRYDLATQIQRLVDKAIARQASPELRFAEVTSTSPLEVRLAGDNSDIGIDRVVASYTPTTNDRVVLAKVGSSWVILGELT